MVRLCGKRPLLVSRLCLCLCLWLPCCVCISLWILPAVDAFALSSSSSSPLTAALLRRSSRQRQHRTGGDAPCPGTRGLHLESPALTPPSSSCLHSTAASVSALPSSHMENKGSLFREGPPLRAWQSKLVRTGLMLYVAGMCVALPLTLYPQKLLYKLGLISKRRKEIMALSTARFCARWMLRFVPFCRLEAVPCERSPSPPEPSIWVCNHVSMLDVFVLLGVDRRLRGRVKRPIKIVYWKGLEANPVTALLFKQAGFIPVQMADNGNGNDNEYDVSSFKKLLKDAKEAFKDGFDIGVLPEGQLNPHPEQGLLPVFPGAYTLAKLSKRPIRMMALYGTHHLWHPLNGMSCERRRVRVRAYPPGRKFDTSHDFLEAFAAVVGHFGAHGTDLPEPDLSAWLHGVKATEGVAPESAAGPSDAPRIPTESPTIATSSNN